MESWHLPNLSVQIAPDCISEYLNFQNFPDPPSKLRLRRSKWALSRPYCQYSELCHARAYKQKKARNAPGRVYINIYIRLNFLLVSVCSDGQSWAALPHAMYVILLDY